MKVNVVSEVANFKTVWGGLYSAYINHVQLLHKLGVEVIINTGTGKADITHIHSYGPYAFYKMLRAHKSVVSSHTLPDTLVGTFKGSRYWLPLAKLYLKAFYNSADLVLALNPHSQNELRKLGVKTKMILLSNTLNNDVFNKDSNLSKNGKKKLAINDKTFVVLGVGHIISRKGIVDFIKTAELLPEFTFVWIGGHVMGALSAETDQMKHLLKNKPTNLILIGGVSYNEMPEYYNAADVFLFPSHQDIAPMAVIEAASCGLPLVLRDLPEYEELFKKRYISAKSPIDFAKAIKKLFNDKIFYEKSQRESRELSVDFSSEIIGKKLLAVYNNLLS